MGRAKGAMKLCLVALTALALAGCGDSTPPQHVDCGPRGVKWLRVDNYGGDGAGREVVVCQDGRVFVVS